MGTAPRMADGNFVVYVDVNTGKRQSRFGQQLSSRMGYIAASLAVCMLLAVALSGSDEGSGLAVKSASITAAKATILSEGRKEKIYARKQMMNQVINMGLAGLPVKDVAIAKGLIAKAGKLPTLAAMKTTKLQDADCANKDVYEMILDKFTGLAANLTTEKDMRVQQNLTTHTEKAAAYTAWIDSESAYREALNKKETAASAVEYAQGQFDKYDTAVTAGEASYAETIAPMAEEKEDLTKQQEMIAEIVKLISGMAQPTATKAIKASNLAQINAKVAELSADKKMPAALQEVSAETIANAMSILNEMSEEITARVEAIDKATQEADQNLANDKALKLKWQVDVVDLSNKKDEETAAANTADLHRNQLDGLYKVKEAAYDDQADDYESDIEQFTTEIAGVNQIVGVIQQLVEAC